MLPNILNAAAAAAAACLLTLSSLTYALPQDATSTTSSGTALSSATSDNITQSDSSKACNNSPDLCNRAYNNITHMGAHDSSFLRDESTGNSIAGNQYHNATAALNSGIRLLQAQVYEENSTLYLCHTTCNLLNAGTLESWLGKIKEWMDKHTSEVVTLLLVNSDNKPAADFGSVFKASGIDTYGYDPSNSTSSGSGGSGGWPTLQSMITSNKRLVSFIASISADAAHPYLLNEFDHVFETAYEVTSAAGFNCTLDRPSKTFDSATAALSAGLLPLMNHFRYNNIAQGIQIPDASNVNDTNSADTSKVGALGTTADKCAKEWGLKPVFVLVDFYDAGPAIDTADRLNGIKATGRSESASAAGGDGDGDGESNGKTSGAAPYGASGASAGAATFVTTLLLSWSLIA